MGSCFLAWVVNEEGKVKVGSEGNGEGERRVVMRCCRELVRGEVLMRGTRTDEIICPTPGLRLNSDYT